MISKHAYISENFLDLGGTDVIFAQNWNFEPKLFLNNPLMKKIDYRCMRVHFCPKNIPKNPKNSKVKNLKDVKKGSKWLSKLIASAKKYLNDVWIAQS